MRLEHQLAEELGKQILGILGKYLDLKKYKVFFFGSRITNTGREGSDIDVGIEGPIIPRIALSKIEEEIEDLPTLYTIEIVDFSRVTPTFKKVAKQHMELVSQK